MTADVELHVITHALVSSSTVCAQRGIRIHMEHVPVVMNTVGTTRLQFLQKSVDPCHVPVGVALRHHRGRINFVQQLRVLFF